MWGGPFQGRKVRTGPFGYFKLLECVRSNHWLNPLVSNRWLVYSAVKTAGFEIEHFSVIAG